MLQEPWVDSITFYNASKDKTFARIPNGSGNFVETTPTFAANNNSTATVEHDVLLTVFPNPTDKLLMIKGEPINDQYIIYNNIGREVSSGRSNDHVIDVSNLNDGLYFVMLDNVMYKVIVQH